MITKDGQILLGMKKRGFGAGKWNGFGGKPHDGESIQDAMVRETKEEINIDLQKIEKIGIILFEFQGKPDIIEVHFFSCTEFLGEPTESEEMKPQWFLFDEIPFDSMWVDDRHWIPLFLEGKKFKGRFLFDPEGNEILEKCLENIEEIK